MTGTFRVAHCQICCRNPQEQERPLISPWFILPIPYMMLQQQRNDSWMSRVGAGLLEGPCDPRGTGGFACQNSPSVFICLPQGVSHSQVPSGILQPMDFDTPFWHSESKGQK